MRCICCDKELSDYEVTLRGVFTGQFLDTCMTCINEAEIPYMSLSQQTQDTDCCIEYDSFDMENDNADA